MIFALGFLATGLLMLLLLPAVWRRAMRLSRRRLEMSMPLSLGEIAADRDQLRAEFAIERRQLEQKQEALGEARAADLAELGRRAIRVAALVDTEKALQGEVAGLSADASGLRRELAESQGEAASLHKALFDSDGLRVRRDDELQILRETHERLQIVAGQQQVTLSDLETQLSLAQMGLDANERQMREAARTLEQRRKEIEILVGERGHARAQVVALTQRRDLLQADLAATNERAGAHQDALRLARAELAATGRETAGLRDAVAAHDQQIEAMSARATALKERNERALSQAYASERDMAQRLDAVRAQISMVEGALQAARDERSRLQRELAQAQQLAETQARHARAPLNTVAAEPASEGAAALRQAIVDLADRLMRHAAPAAKRDAAAAPTAPSSDVDATPPPQRRLRGQVKKPVDKVAASADPPVL